MKNYLLYSIILFVVVSCIPEEDISGPGSIEGKVLNETGKPVANVSVHITGNSFNQNTTTDAQGIFTFEEVPPGDNYKLVASHPDYEEDILYINVFPLSKTGPTLLEDFELAQLPPILQVSNDSIDFGFDQTELTFQITNGGPGNLNWTIEKENDMNWLTVSPPSGPNDEEVILSLSNPRNELPRQKNSGKITIKSQGGQASIDIYANRVPNDTIFRLNLRESKGISDGEFTLAPDTVTEGDEDLIWCFTPDPYKVCKDYCLIKLFAFFHKPSNKELQLFFQMEVQDWGEDKVQYGKKTQFKGNDILNVFDINNDYQEFENWKIIKVEREDGNGNLFELQSWTRGNDPPYLLKYIDEDFETDLDIYTDLGPADIIGITRTSDFDQTRVIIKFNYTLHITLKELTE